MEWSIQDVARSAGTTSRTLRHYGELGLLSPVRVGSNGYRYYDEYSLVQLQRILLLRELGLGLKAIAEVLDGERDAIAALRTHLELLKRERERITRQIESVQTTLRKTEGGEQLMPAEIFDGFDVAEHKDEVVRRWGQQAYDRSHSWWASMSAAEQQAFQQRQHDIAAGFGQAAADGRSADSDEVQDLARRQVEWIVSTDSTPQTPTRSHIVALGQMYSSDPQFAANYNKHGEGTADLLRDALAVYAERHLAD